MTSKNYRKTKARKARPNFEPSLPGSMAEQGNVPTVSACMMVKNEEGLLPQCLESIKDVVDEIIVVDTGSTDRTVEIAKRYGGKVFHHPWENDFSKHRNQSISYASGDWILIIDADERLEKGSGDLVKTSIKDDQIDTILVTVISYMNNHMSESWTNQVRLFRNNAGISYIGRVHNRLVGFSAPRAYPLCLHHYGYDLSSEKRKAKFDRISSLLKLQIEEEPDVFRHRHDLAACYLTNFMYEEATAEGRKALKMAGNPINDQQGLLPWTYFITAFAYLKLGQHDNAEKYAEMALQAFPGHLDSLFILVIVYHNCHNWNGLESLSRQYLDILEGLKRDPSKTGHIMLNTVNEHWRVHLALGDLYLERGEYSKADIEFGRALSVTPNPSECHRMIGHFHSARGTWELAENHYKSALNSNPQCPEACLALARVYKSWKKYDEYRRTIERLKKQETQDLDGLKEIGICDLRFGNYRSAIQYFNMALEENPTDVETHINLALAYKYTGAVKGAEEHNLRALEIKEDSVDAMSNLGHLYYESAQYHKAKETYLRALETNKHLIDLQLRLANTYLFQGELEKCVEACASILRHLDLSLNKTLHDLKDLAEVFLLISSRLKLLGKNRLSEEAKRSAILLAQVSFKESSASES